MSLLSPETRIAITPGRVALATRGSCREAAVAEGEDVLDALAKLLRESSVKGRARAILSHELAHISLVQAPPVFLNNTEMAGWVRQRLDERMGDSIQGRRITWEPAPPGQSILAASVDENWLLRLQQCLEHAGLRLQACQPWLSAASTRMRTGLGKGTAWLALAEPGRITLARLQQGVFMGLRSNRIGEDVGAELAAMIARESLLVGIATSAPVWLESAAGRVTTPRGLEIRQPASTKAGLAAMLGA